MAASYTMKPPLSWARSSEREGDVVKETVVGSKVQEALQLPLDPNQAVFDNGMFTKEANKRAVPAGVSWASWKQYSSDGIQCGPTFDLRHFQVQFNLGNVGKITKVWLRSPYYPDNYFPINDNAYIYFNGNFVAKLGTSYGARNLGFNGSAPYANETDGWVGNGDLGSLPVSHLRVGGNVIDIVAGERCLWGGMGKLELVLEVEATEPFLDLPLEYKSKGRSFEDVAFDPVAWFDHQYPLQDYCCDPPVLLYYGKLKNLYYRSHNGYDYGLKNGVELNTPVLAAASGWAEFHPWEKTGGAGNVIKIDHGNGYQTWYEHLSGDGLVVNTEGKSVYVQKGQAIGKVGMTGRTTGPHIHFSVYKDANGNGNFDDDIPYGVTDPLGWEGDSDDPWALWTDGKRYGSTSVALFLARRPVDKVAIPTSGGTLTTDKVTISVPAGASLEPFLLNFLFGPAGSFSQSILGVGPSFFLTALGSFNQEIQELREPATIEYNYSALDVTNIVEATLKMYWFNQVTGSWEALPSVVDTGSKLIRAVTTHFSQFAVMGQARDLIPPETELIITGENGEDHWYRSDVRVSLESRDNEGGVGVHATLYSLNGNDWFEYTQPLEFTEEGSYTISYESYDNADNKEERKSFEFHIDKTPPRVEVRGSPSVLWPANGKMVDVRVDGESFDAHLKQTHLTVVDEYGLTEPQIAGFGQTVALEAARKGEDLDGRTYTITARAEDVAGNIAEARTEVVVAHDQRQRKENE